MATLENKRAFKGMVGNVVFRNYRGKPIVQSRPTHVKQTTATQKSASEFGKCSRWAKQLRLGLTPFLVGQTDSALYQRFTAAIYNAVKSNTALPKGERSPLNSDMASLQGFEFNTHSPFATYFKPTIAAQRNANNEVVLTIQDIDPSTDIVFPDGCTTAKLVVVIYATNFSDTTTPLMFHSIIPIAQNSTLPAQELLRTPSIPEGYLVLAAAKLLYYTPNLLTESTPLNTKDFSPAMVVLAEAIL
jgi:hypothetical protein